MQGSTEVDVVYRARRRRHGQLVTVAALVILAASCGSSIPKSGGTKAKPGTTESTSSTSTSSSSTTSASTASTVPLATASTLPPTDTIPRDSKAWVDAGKHVDPATYRVPATASGYAGSPVFKSPSGRIRCGNVGGSHQQTVDFLFCAISVTFPDGTWSGHAPASFPGLPVSAECQAAHEDRGAGWAPNIVSMGNRGVQRGICPTQIVLPPYGSVLPYGSTVDYNGFACRMESDGMTCITPPGEGFFMSSTAYREFG